MNNCSRYNLNILTAILENLSEYGGKTIGLSGDKLTVQEYADVLSKHLRPKNFQVSCVVDEL